MIANIVDRRAAMASRYSEFSAWTEYTCEVDVAFEPSGNDNRCKGATYFESGCDFAYDDLKNTTIAEAVKYATEKWPLTPTTLYLYPVGLLDHKTSSSIGALYDVET
jgi:hypothetical protein